MMMHICVMMTSDLGGSPCLGACPRSDGRESTLVMSSCHSSHLSVCTCVPHSLGFRRVSLFVGSLSVVGLCCQSFGCAPVVSCCSAHTQSMSLQLQLHLRLIVLPISSSAAFLGQVLSLVKPTLLPAPACGRSPQEHHLPRKVSSHFPLLAWLAPFPVSRLP